MPNDLRPFGGKAIDWRSDRFHAARIKLTFVYVLILAVVLFLSSSILYSAFSSRLERRFHRIPTTQGFFIAQEIVTPRQQDVLQDLFHSLLRVNGVLLLAGGVLSYWLAGLTLQPIKAAYDRQRRFLGDASHELRTPLTILRIDFENELANEKISTREHGRLNSHLEEVERMSRLVRDLLTLSRLDEAADERLELAVIGLQPVLTSTVERLQSLAKHHQVSLRSDIRQDVSISGSEDWLTHIFSNIIKNAVVYNKQGGKVDVILEARGNMAAIMVKDTGVGIAREDLAKVFDRFYRVDKSRTRETGGSGLGLSIVQVMVQRLGGSIEMESEFEKGTTVTLRFPISKSS